MAVARLAEAVAMEIALNAVRIHGYGARPSADVGTAVKGTTRSSAT